MYRKHYLHVYSKVTQKSKEIYPYLHLTVVCLFNSDHKSTYLCVYTIMYICNMTDNWYMQLIRLIISWLDFSKNTPTAIKNP